MSPESRELLNKMSRMVSDANTLQDANIVERYLSLANRRIKKINDGGWDILGACMGIQSHYESKFGKFVSRSEGIQL